MRIVCAVLFVAASALPAFAQREPVIVVPGHPGVPVYINGIDASWGIVEGEFGLDRPGMVTPTVTYRPYFTAAPYAVRAYYPRDRRRPGYGRLEIVPPRNHAVPPPAPTYYRDWNAESAPGPVTDYPAAAPGLITPRIELGNGRRQDPHHSEENHHGS